MRTFAGVDLPAFERFKVDFRTTAYACRMLLCPRASAGFDSEEQLLEHEASHLRIICKVAGCQYPTFSSKQALAQHQAKFHPTDTATPRLKAIRRLQSRLAPSMSLRESYQSHKETGRELVGQAPGLDEPRLSASREIDMAGLPAKADQKEVNRYAHRITEAILNLSKHYHGQEDIGALWFELRQAIQEPRLAHLTDPSLWEPVRRVFLESSFEAACWTALVDLVCKRLTHPPDLIAFLKSLSRALPNYEENRAIWGALLIGLPPAARLDPQLWQLLGGRMKLETRTNFGVLGLGFLISCIPKDNRQVPMLCEAIKTGIPELSSYTARLMNHLGNRDAVVIVIDDSDDEMSSDPATQPSNSERRDAGPETSTNKEYGDLRAVIDQAEAIWKKYQCEVEPKLPLLNKFSGKAKNVPNMDQASDGSGSASNMTTNSHLQNGEPSSGSEPDPIGRNIDTSRETTDWLRRWAAKQERSSDAHAGLCTLSEELEKAPRDVKETVLFWGRLGAQAVRLPASCHLPASWIALCYRAVPDEATKNEQFWTMFFLSLPRIQHPVAGVWKALLDEVRNHRDLWDERFWREIGRKIPNNQATFTVWVDVFAAVLNHTRSHPALWDAFERGVPAMADLVEAIKDVLVIRNLVSTTP
ncbi:hypothetical protein QBC42DRAFT_262341 [Cladorrhinum samala]|uniref:Uncharacterized protein n=1 Tax=Cladorrhinum samala TaxID=585594 RepID=A0AAV9HXC1_9PEZI|nr:hypothetical protein QBC42DRAFT_262341 [Cladorrhinum samala]